MNRIITVLRRMAWVLAGLAALGGTALAHAGQHGETNTGSVALVLFAVGGSALGVTVVLDRVGGVDQRFADVSVVVGLLAVVAGAGIYMF